MARTTVSSTQYRADAIKKNVTKTSNVVWGGAASSSLDVYAISGITNRTAVFIIHGSWCDVTTWRSYNPLVGLAQTLAENGFIAFLPDFLQVTGSSGNVDTSFRQGMITDILALMTWARANVATYGGSSTRIAILGESGGGQLGLMAGIQGIAGTTRPDAVVAWSPATRLDRTAYASGQAHSSAGVFMNNYLATTNQSVGADAIIAQQFSPYNQVSSNLPPIRIVGSSNEPNLGIQQSDFDDMQTAALAVGVDSTERIITGTVHADFRNADDQGSMAWLHSRLGTKIVSRSAASGRTAASSRSSA